MNWSKTKTIFILCFLLLDVFLGYQMYQRQRVNEQQLSNYNKNYFKNDNKNNNVVIKASPPSTDQKLFFLKGAFTNFEKDKDAKKEIDTIAQANPNISFSMSSNGQILTAAFDTTINPIKAPQTATEYETFLKTFVYKGEQYEHWPSDNSKDNVIHFIQMFNGNPLFSVSVDNGKLYMLNVFTDGDVVTGYQQILMKTLPKNPVKATMTSDEAIQILSENYLQAGENPTVDDINLGYINLASDIKESRELPYILAWYIHVKTDDGNRSFFITMFGKVYENDIGEKGSGAS